MKMAGYGIVWHGLAVGLMRDFLYTWYDCIEMTDLNTSHTEECAPIVLSVAVQYLCAYTTSHLL